MLKRQTSSRARRIANAPIFGLTLGALIGFAGAAAAAPALPTGGTVQAGAATIAKASGSTLTIDQSSSRAIIDWSSFSIGQGGTVQFDNGSGATLNRVTGTNLSSIDGLLSATGGVYLINPNGVIIGKSGVVDTGGTFVASTQDLTNASFMGGGTLTFSGASTASVLNLGRVGSLGGDVALIASKVENDGSITASQGDVGLAAGFQVTMSDAAQNDGKFQVRVGGSGTSATNTGSIQAAEAELRANGGNVYALAGNTGGVIEATGVSTNDGKVLLIAEGGNVTANGTIQATTSTGAGGDVETSGETVNFAGLTVKAGSWLVDPTNLTIDAPAASSIDNSLDQGTSVILTTTASGSSGPGVTGSGAGDIAIASAVSWFTTATLTLDAYHSINIDAPITASGAGGVVLNTNYNNVGGGGDYGFGLTATGFSGSLSFTNASGALTINGTSYTLEATPAALVTAINANSSGNFALAASGSLGTSASAFIPTFSGNLTGLGHTISGMTVDDTGFNADDGLFGLQTAGAIRDIGLVGGSVISYGGFAGDLVGWQSAGSITDAYATGAVSAPGAAYVGGLVGEADGAISDAYATGAVSAASGAFAGGLVGQSGGAISDVYATGAVSATGGYDVGGLVGDELPNATITNAFATGAVSGSSFLGGLAGESAGSISDAYATGAVAAGSGVGGLVGSEIAGTITDSYWDSQTTGQSSSAGGTPETTAALQGALPSGFASSVWSTGTGLYPYLTNFFPGGAQAVSGIAYSNAGTTPLAGGSSVGVVANGVSLGTVTTGANGYYYVFTAAGGVPSGDSVLAYATNSATYTVSTGAADTSGVNLYGDTLTATTSDTLYSAARSDVAAAAGDVTAAQAALSGVSAFDLHATGASFTLDQVVSTAGSISVTTTAANAPIIVEQPITLSNSGSLTVDAAGVLTIEAPVIVSGAGSVSLTAADGYGFGLTGSGFLGSLSFTRGQGAGASLTIDGSPYTLIYSMADLASELNGSTGDFALATPLTSTTIYPGAVVASFGGTFTGLGNTITGLTIHDAGAQYVGLFGQQTGGAVRDIGLVGGLVSSGGAVGDLVGLADAGLITDAYATGKVSGTGYSIGGLVGQEDGAISDAYATGAVSGGMGGAGGLVGGLGAGSITDAYATGAVSGALDVGGLVGQEDGAISDAYATGAVSGDSNVGGLVGSQLSAAITDAYATGAVSGYADIGGLVGDQAGGSITDGYWDTGTTGQSSSAGGTGQTTAQLQGALPTFANAVWSTGPGLYPYLTNFFPNGVQAISGIAYSDSGVTPAASNGAGAQYVYVDIAGSQSSVTTGANGYYYLATAAGTISAGGTAVVAYTQTGGATLIGESLIAATGTTQHLDIWADTLIAPTTAASLPAAPTTVTALLGQDGDAALLSAAAGSDTLPTSGVSSLTQVGYIATGAGGFNVNEAVATTGLYAMTTGGPLTVSVAQTLNAADLSLYASGALAIDAPIVVDGVGTVNLAAGFGGSGDYGFDLTAAGFQGSLSFADTSSTLTIDDASYTLEATPTALVTAINADSAGNFALAASGNLTTSYTSAPIATFSGDFTGLGHTIASLTIIDTSGNGYDGLFGEQTGGAIRDIGLVGGSVAGANYVGDLLGGQDGGTVTDAYATGAVSATAVGAGGLVGLQLSGSITDAYATGAVSGGNYDAGGLVGAQEAGAISDAYATGAVSGSDTVGGLVGYQSGGTITDTYATGAVSAIGYVGGLVGQQINGAITDAYATGAVSASGGGAGGLVGYSQRPVTDGYWDTSTTGQSSSTFGGTGLTTAQLQGTLPSFQNSTLWSTGPGLYPYLTNFFPNGVQVVSGYTYRNGGTTVASGATVSAIAGATAFGTATSGANGYYYIFAPAGSAVGGQTLLTYAASTDSATLTAVTGATVQSGVNLYGSAMTVPTSALTLSTAPTLTVAQTSGLAADGSIAAAATVIGDTTALGLVASGASFTVNVAPTTTLLIKTTAGSITVATSFTLAGSDYLTLDSYRSIAIDAPITVSGAGAVNLVTNDGGTGGDYGFGFTGSGFSGSLSFASEGSDPTLTIDGAHYTLVYSMSQLSGISGTGDYALATSMNSAGYSSAVVASFGGIFTGLGNYITDLTISGASDDAGLFGTLNGGGVVRDIGLVGGTVAGGAGVGALVGNDGGSILNAVSTVDVSGSSDVGGLVGYEASIGVISSSAAHGATVSGTSGVGGLVGKSAGAIENASSSDSVSGDRYVGGFAGYISGAIADASAIGAVTGTGSDQAYIGGLAGESLGTISGSSAGTGNVSGTAYVGGLVGYNAATGTLSDDTTSGATVSGTSVIGGLVGENLGTIENGSSSSDAVTGTRYVGGLAGYSTKIILHSSASGTVSGTTEAGGLVGYNSGMISSTSAATGNVSGTTDVGGLAGYNSGDIIAASATGDVTGTGAKPVDLGGLVGENGAAGVITTSQATDGRVSAPGGFHLGGLVGWNEGQISQSFATETVGSNGTGEALGGLVGYATAGSEITDTYATGQVEAGIDVGGLVGDNAGSVATSWTSGAVAAGASSGGVVGANKTTGLFTNVYWDVGTTGRASAFGVGSLNSSTNVTGIGGTTSKNPHSQSTYTGFNFTSVWTINPGTSRPYLQNVTPQTPPN